MKRRSAVLLAVAAGLFALWIGYLAFLALTQRRPVVLSRPQFLVANLWVIAEVDDPAGPVKVTEVVYPAAKAEALKGTTIEVKNLAKCEKDWTGKGTYILPLTAEGQLYHVTAIPRSPGYGSGPPRIYPDTPPAREQLAGMPHS
jgi:hypothetical protein